MKMFSTVGLLGFLSISFCVLVSGIQEISINSDEGEDDFGEAFLKSFQSTLNQNHNPYNEQMEVREVDPIYGYPNASIEDITITGQTNDYSHSFFGIPYAEPPIGDKRYMPPVAKTFQDDIEAFEPNRVICIQSTSNSDQSEDCLVLNIHVPASVNAESFTNQQFDQLLPVMFWIHGGSFSMGSGTSKSYDGRFLSNSTNTVVVTINYRLGALGYLVFEENGVAFNGNQGIKDQQLALKWVNDYIQNFGGDPKQVTIFGVSAGAQSVMFHLASPVSKPYIKRCIMESNPAVYDYMNFDRAKELTAGLIELLDCENNYNSNVECLRNVAATDIINKTKGVQKLSIMEGDHRSMVEPFRPVVDGDEFPKQPLAMFQDGNWNKDVEVIMGTNRDELGIVKAKFHDIKLRSTFFQKVNEFLVGAELEPNVTAEYSKLIPAGESGPTFDYTGIIAQEVGDLYFVCPSRLLARFISQTSTSDNNYLYSWEHTSCDDPLELCHYAGHGMEVRYVFQTLGYTGHINGAEEQAISTMFSDLWGSFVYTGTPTSISHDTWIKYEQLNEGNTNNWKNLYMQYPRATMESHYRADICDFWDSLNYYVELTPEPIPTDPSGGGDNGSAKTTISSAVLLLSFFFSYFFINS